LACRLPRCRRAGEFSNSRWARTIDPPRRALTGFGPKRRDLSALTTARLPSSQATTWRRRRIPPIRRRPAQLTGGGGRARKNRQVDQLYAIPLRAFNLRPPRMGLASAPGRLAPSATGSAPYRGLPRDHGERRSRAAPRAPARRGLNLKAASGRARAATYPGPAK